MSVGYYSSKKTDDICEDVCGQVIYSSYSSIKVLIFFFIWSNGCLVVFR
jgi:hypothetical protein